MNSIRFYEYCEPENKFLWKVDSVVVPHIGSDIIIKDVKWFVLDVLTTYEENETKVDIVLEKIDE